MKFKPLPADTNVKAKIKKEQKEKHYVSKEEANRFIRNRKIKRISASEDTVTISLTDGRRVVVAPGAVHPYKIKRKVGDVWVCMTDREVQVMNDQIETAFKKMIKSIPHECRPCSINLTSSDVF
jgi:hypothetical protein